MRKMFTLVVALAMTLGMVGTATAHDHGAPWPAHGHMLVLHVGYDAEGEPVSYGKCVDIAGGKQLDRAHHTTIHTGRAGTALEEAGHAVVPTADLTFGPDGPLLWADCAEFAEMFGPPRDQPGRR